MHLQDKVAVVTGAASGIGKEIAKTYFNAGAKVAIADLNLESAQAVAREFDPSGQRLDFRIAYVRLGKASFT